MAEQRPGASARSQNGSRRQERAQRILDAAATLILRWGYNKTTIDDVARQAGVAKGTIYLHWQTREELFHALMRRERVELAEEIKRRVGEDPAGSTLAGLLKHSTLAVVKRPLMKAVLLRDMEVIGKLAHGELRGAADAERLAGFTTYLEVLREHGLVRTDLRPSALVYTLSAIFLGFFLAGPLVPDDSRVPDEELAELLADTVHRALEPGRSFAADELQIATAAVARYLDQDVARAREKLQQELRSKV